MFSLNMSVFVQTIDIPQEVDTQKSRFLWRLLIFVVLSSFITDMLYPIVSNQGALFLIVSPGEVVKGLHICIIFSLIFLRKRIEIYSRELLFGFFFLFMAIIFLLCSQGNIQTEIKQRLAFSIKIIYLILLMSLIRTILIQREATADEIVSLLIFTSFIFIVIPIYLSYFGVIGYRSYIVQTERMGFKGLMYATNSISVQLLTVLPLVFVFKINPIISYLTLGASLLLGSKAATGGAFLTFLFFFFTFPFFRRKEASWKNAFFFLMLIPILYYGRKIYGPIQQRNMELYLSKYKQSGTLMSNITTGRWEGIYYLPEFLSSIGLLEIILGTTTNPFAEIDWLNMLVCFGLIGVLWYILFIKDLLTFSFKNLFKSKESSAVAFAFLMILGHSLLGGHIIGDAVVAYPVATIFVLNHYFTTCTSFQETQA